MGGTTRAAALLLYRQSGVCPMVPVIVLVLAIVVVSQAPAAAQVEEGAKVFAAQKCSICHSIAGVGNKKLPLDGVGSKLSAAQIREWIVDPRAAEKKANSTTKPVMRAYPNLPKTDVDALVAYLQSLKK
jgi:mono/diheme cytochrome c family protein